MMLRDDMPLFGLFGGAKDDTDADFLACAIRETLEETNLPPDMVTPDTMRFLLRVNGIDPDTDQIMEDLYIYGLDIGDFPLALGDEGIGIYFFAPDKLPLNVTNYSRDVALRALQGPQPETLQNPVTFIFPGEFEHLLQHPLSDFTALETWNAHPNVIAKRAAGRLKYDPFHDQRV